MENIIIRNLRPVLVIVMLFIFNQVFPQQTIKIRFFDKENKSRFIENYYVSLYNDNFSKHITQSNDSIFTISNNDKKSNNFIRLERGGRFYDLKIDTLNICFDFYINQNYKGVRYNAHFMNIKGEEMFWKKKSDELYDEEETLIECSVFRNGFLFEMEFPEDWVPF